MASLPVDLSTVVDSVTRTVDGGGNSADTPRRTRQKFQAVRAATVQGQSTSDPVEQSSKEQLSASADCSQPESAQSGSAERDDGEGSESDNDDPLFNPQELDRREASSTGSASSEDLPRQAKKIRKNSDAMVPSSRSKTNATQPRAALVYSGEPKVLLSDEMPDDEIRTRFEKKTLEVQNRMQFCKVLSVINKNLHSVRSRSEEWGGIFNRTYFSTVVANAKNNYILLDETFLKGLNGKKTWDVPSFDTFLKDCNKTVWQDSGVDLCEFFDMFLQKLNTTKGKQGPNSFARLLCQFEDDSSKTNIIIERFERNYRRPKTKNSENLDSSVCASDIVERENEAISREYLGETNTADDATRDQVASGANPKPKRGRRGKKAAPQAYSAALTSPSPVRAMAMPLPGAATQSTETACAQNHVSNETSNCFQNFDFFGPSPSPTESPSQCAADGSEQPTSLYALFSGQVVEMSGKAPSSAVVVSGQILESSGAAVSSSAVIPSENSEVSGAAASPSAGVTGSVRNSRKTVSSFAAVLSRRVQNEAELVASSAEVFARQLHEGSADAPRTSVNDGSLSQSGQDDDEYGAGEGGEANAAQDEDESEEDIEINDFSTVMQDVYHNMGRNLAQVVISNLPSQIGQVMASFPDRLREQRSALESSLERLTKQNKKLAGKLQEVRVEHNHLEEVRARSAEDVRKSAQILKQTQDRQESLDREIRSKETELSRLNESVNQSQQQLENLKTGVEDLKTAERESQKSLEGFQEKLDRFEAIDGEIREAQSKLDDLTNKVNEKEQQKDLANRSLESKCLDLKLKIKELQEVKLELAKEKGQHVQNMQRENEAHKSKLEQEKTQHDERLAAELAKLNAEKAEVARMKLEFESKLEQVCVDRLGISQSQEELQSKRKDLDMQYARLNASMNSNEELTKELRDRLESVQRYKITQDAAIKAREAAAEQEILRENAIIARDRQEASAFLEYVRQARSEVCRQLRAAQHRIFQQVEDIIQTVGPNYPTIVPSLRSIELVEPPRLLSFDDYISTTAQSRVENYEDQRRQEEITACLQYIENGDGAAGADLMRAAGGDGMRAAGGDAMRAAADAAVDAGGESLAVQFEAPDSESLAAFEL